MINGLYLRKLEVRLSQNTAIVFAKCEEAIGTMPSMARRRAFRIRRPLPFPAGCFRQKRMWQLQTGLQVALDGG